MPRSLSTLMSPDEMKQLANAQAARAKRIKDGPERLRILTLADAMTNVAEIKKRLLKYQRRLLN
jgi:hypothetical protein